MKIVISIEYLSRLNEAHELGPKSFMKGNLIASFDVDNLICVRARRFRFW